MTSYHVWPVNSQTNGVKHRATIPKERLFNECKHCGYIGRGVMEKWKNGDWTWRCPHCTTARRYPR